MFIPVQKYVNKRIYNCDAVKLKVIENVNADG